jgi:hypothetical protein
MVLALQYALFIRKQVPQDAKTFFCEPDHFSEKCGARPVSVACQILNFLILERG